MIEELRELGYCAFGPVLFEFNRWLLQAVQAEEAERLYFLAREGYFLLKLYQHYVDVCGLRKAPEAKYLLASRRALFGAAEKDEDLLLYIFGHPQYKGTLHHLVETRLGVGSEVLKQARLADRDIPAFTKVEEMVSAAAPVIPLLNDAAAHEREQLLQYLEKEGVFEQQRLAVVDLGYSGSIQRFLHTITGLPTLGFYAAVHARSDEWTSCKNQITYCFGKTGAEVIPFFRFSLYLESWLTAPHGQLERFTPGETGPSPVFAGPGRMQREFHIAEAIFQGVKDYFSDAAILKVGTLLDPGPLGPNTQLLMDAFVRSGVMDQTASALTVEDNFSNLGEIEVAMHYRGLMEREARRRSN